MNITTEKSFPYLERDADGAKPYVLSDIQRKKLDEWISVRGKDKGPLFYCYDRAYGNECRFGPQGIYSMATALGATPHRLRHASITETRLTTHGTMALNKVRELADEVKDSKVKAFLEEAAHCISVGACRAAIVLGWCATIYHLHRKVEAVGFDKFNQASTQMKNTAAGRFKRWSKEFDVHNAADLIAVFDSDLIWVLEGMNLIDGNENQRLMMCFQWRCHSAHPAEPPIEEAHMLAFFTDVVRIVLTNPRLQP